MSLQRYPQYRDSGVSGRLTGGNTWHGLSIDTLSTALAPACRRHKEGNSNEHCTSSAISTTAYSTVTDFAKLRGLSTSVPRASAVW